MHRFSKCPRSRFLLVAAMAGLVVGCMGSPGALAPCDPTSDHRPICDLMNPEDLGLLPDTSWLIVSEMAPRENEEDAGESGPTPRAGRLTAIHRMDLERRTLYPEPDGSARAETIMSGWGDPDCPGPPDRDRFGPHGIDVGLRPDGRAVLAVVNHGGREAVELFEISSGHTPALDWRGCVPMPEGVLPNDVALLPDGGFVVTNFMPAFDGIGPGAIWSLLKISLGANTGSILHWEPGREVVEIPNSEGSAPNGLEVSLDGTEIFVAEWGARKVYRLRLEPEGPPMRDEVAVGHHPDNLTWTRDGRLLVAGQEGGVGDAMGCGEIRDAGCDIGYSVYRIEPIALEATRIVEGRGAASVALEVGDEIYVGVFIGDQILRVPRPD